MDHSARNGLRRFWGIPRPVEHLERWIGRHLAVNPVVFSAIKLGIITPLIVLALSTVAILPPDRRLVTSLLAAFFILDFVEAAVAKERRLEPRSARLFDRFTDYPLLFAVSFFALEVVPAPLLGAKLALDVLLLVLFVVGRGQIDNRLRTGISYASLVALTYVGQGWGWLLTPRVVQYVLWANIAFSGTAAAFYLGFLQKRFVADALSAANLLCGAFSIYFASLHRFEISLLFVILGAAFDGFDGAAARRWGGTRFGVYSDDIADGVNYGIAPGFALYFALDGPSGWLVGSFYAVFTLARLVFFTLNKSGSDPNYFAGVPSPVGGLIAMASIVVFEDHPGILGLMIGIAAAQMVSFSTHYRHLGRALATQRRALLGAPAYLLVLLLGLRFWGPKGAAGVILAGNLVYGFLPTVLAFSRVVAVNRVRRHRVHGVTEGSPVDRDEDAAHPTPQVGVPVMPPAPLRVTPPLEAPRHD